MFVASFLIGLREGFEAALVIGILLAYVSRLERHDRKRNIWWGVAIATVLSLGIGALFTFGQYALTFTAQELIGGVLSLIAVAMITWMVFWMLRMGKSLAQDLRQSVDRALLLGSGWAIFWLAFVTVGREGVETTLLLWGWAGDPAALVGALLGIALSVGLGILLNRSMVRVRLSAFFTWTGVFLIVVTAGVLAYAIHDLQEAAVLPGPFSGAPITPTNFRTGEVLVGLTDGPFWAAAYPFGWAFDLTGTISPDGTLAAILTGLTGFTPLMSWLEVTAWALYLAIVMSLFVRRARTRAHSSGQISVRPSPHHHSPSPSDASRQESLQGEP